MWLPLICVLSGSLMVVVVMVTRMALLVVIMIALGLVGVFTFTAFFPVVILIDGIITTVIVTTATATTTATAAAATAATIAVGILTEHPLFPVDATN